MKRTNRGFKIYSEFKDTYGNKITVQESSSACAARVWVFTENSKGDDCSFDTATGMYISAAPHLSVSNAKRLVKALTKFIEDNK